jgi:hypothetical protein
MSKFLTDLEALAFMHEFTQAYLKHFSMGLYLLLPSETRTTGVYINLEHPRTEEEKVLTLSRVPTAGLWKVSMTSNMEADVLGKVDLLTLCKPFMQELIPVPKSILPEADAKTRFATNRLIQLLETQLPQASVKRHDPHSSEGHTFVDVRLNGRHVVVQHSILLGFGLSYRNLDDFGNQAPDELNIYVGGTFERIKHLLTADPDPTTLRE